MLSRDILTFALPRIVTLLKYFEIPVNVSLASTFSAAIEIEYKFLDSIFKRTQEAFQYQKFY